MSSIPITLDQVVTLGQAYEIIGPGVTCEDGCGWLGTHQGDLNNHQGSPDCKSSSKIYRFVCGKPLLGINPGDGSQDMTYLCQLRFETEEAAESHRNQQRLHNQVNKCDECRKMYVLAESLTAHARGKDHKTPYTCPHHPDFTGMKSLDSIASHNTKFHSDKTPELEVCKGCGKEAAVVHEKGVKGEIGMGHCHNCASKIYQDRRSVNCGHSDCVGKPPIVISLMDLHDYVHHGADPIALGLQYVCHNPDCKVRRWKGKNGRAFATATPATLERHFNAKRHTGCKAYRKAQIAAQKTAQAEGSGGRKRAASAVAGPSGTSKKSK